MPTQSKRNPGAACHSTVMAWPGATFHVVVSTTGPDPGALVQKDARASSASAAPTSTVSYPPGVKVSVGNVSVPSIGAPEGVARLARASVVGSPPRGTTTTRSPEFPGAWYVTGRSEPTSTRRLPGETRTGGGTCVTSKVDTTAR